LPLTHKKIYTQNIDYRIFNLVAFCEVMFLPAAGRYVVKKQSIETASGKNFN